MPRREDNHRGMVLMEIMLAFTVVGILIAWAWPRFDVAVEQTRVDQAAAALRSVWLGQRLQWLEHHAFTGSLQDLADQRLVDDALLTAGEPFSFTLASSGPEQFVALASRTGSSVWSGTLSVDESGDVAGSTQKPGGWVVTPAGN